MQRIISITIFFLVFQPTFAAPTLILGGPAKAIAQEQAEMSESDSSDSDFVPDTPKERVVDNENHYTCYDLLAIPLILLTIPAGCLWVYVKVHGN